MQTLLDQSKSDFPTSLLKNEEHIPLSFAQERLWFFTQIEPGSPLYNIPVAVRLSGPLRRGALEKSVDAIVRRHEALRTNFISEGGIPFQVIRDDAALTTQFHDLSRVPLRERDDAVQNLIAAEAVKPFDLTSDLLIRSMLIRLDEEEHIFVVTMHHIISDEWSLNVFFRELSVLYGSAVADNANELPELSIQFADYAIWQRECLNSENMAREIRYWKKQLGNDFAPLELPADRRRPDIQTYRGATKTVALPKHSLESIEELSRQEKATVFMTTLAAFKALLHRWTGQEQISIGSAISGRNKLECENLIGFFVNTLILRTDVSATMTFRELLARVREMTLGAYAHQDLPFEKLVAALPGGRTAGNVSFLRVMFSLQDNSENPIALPGIQAEALEVDSNTAKFDLTFVVRSHVNGLSLVAEYNSDLFAPETIARFLNQYAQLLDSVRKNPDEKISQLGLLGDADYQRLLVDWNATETDYPRTKCIPELFAAQAAARPDVVAVKFGENQITYRELHERSNQLAHHLRTAGVGPDILVAVCMERSVEMMIAFLGILKAGGAYVPLDLDYPSERLSFMIKDSQSPVLLTQQHLAARFDSEQIKVISLDADAGTFSGQPISTPATQINAENIAYVIYTSGSTGQPKGVAVPHRAVVRLLFNTNYIALGIEDRIAQASNSSFDAATFEIWGALLHGGQLIGFNRETILSPEMLAREIELHRITTIFLTTALFNQIAENAPAAFRGVKNVLFGGEAVDPRWVREILRAGPPQRLLHVYGPTESTTFASWFEIKAVPENATTIPIGKPLSNTQFFVLDRNLQPVPIGVSGELHIGGDGLACGYFHRPELTSAKFIRNPFSTEAGSRLYKTGDLVRYLPDGNIEFLGRADHQVKIRGFRIELQEIETVLRQREDIKDALVLLHEADGEKQLACYFVAAKNSNPDAESLRQFLKQKLPNFMVPSAFVALKEFPLNANGKIDREALPSPQRARVAEAQPRAMSYLEKRLQEIWESVLGRDAVGLRDNFFDLGGHSLLAVKLFAQIEKQLGKKLPLALLFQSPTIEQLAAAISSDVATQPESCLIEIQPHGTKAPIFWLHTLGGGGGGGVLRYQKLSQLLGPDQPSYGLVAPKEPFTRMEVMAAHYIQQMRSVRPKGPYHLGGYCFGGVVAYEIAQQLRAAGDEVGLVALLDSAPANVADTRSLSENALRLFTSLPRRVGHFFEQEPAEIFARLKRKSKQLERALLALFRPRHAHGATRSIALEDVIDMSQYPKDYKRYAEVHWQALLHYVPKPYAGKITLFETTKSPGQATVEMVWKALAGQHLEVRHIPSTHEKMLEAPFVQMVAAQLSECLEQIEDPINACAA